MLNSEGSRSQLLCCLLAYWFAYKLIPHSLQPTSPVLHNPKGHPAPHMGLVANSAPFEPKAHFPPFAIISI